MIDSITVLTAFLVFCATCVCDMWCTNRREKTARKELQRQADVWRLIIRDIDDQRSGIIPLKVADQNRNK